MSVQPPRSSRPLLGFYLAIGAWLIVHAWVALSASVHKSTTNDEIAHITGGYTFNLLHDFRVQPENGVLPQRWHALPYLWKHSQYPELGGYAWNRGLAYQVAYDFFYRSDNDPENLLFTGRAMNVFWGAGVLLLIAFTTRRFFGTAAAIITTGVAALSPTLLAHSALATSDMAMTFFFVASTLAFWRHVNHPNLRTFGLSSVVFGLACVAKFSAVMLLPMMVVLLIVRASATAPVSGIWSGGNNSWLQRITNLTGWWAGHGLVAFIVIWVFYGFRFSMMSPDLPVGTMPLAWENILSAHPDWEPLIFSLRDIKILPEAFLYGFSYVLAFSLARGAFLDGQLSTEGWVDFFPKTFLYKSTPLELLTLILMLGVLGWWWCKEKNNKLRAVYRWTPGFVLLIVYWAFSLTSNLNIGHRHILPTYPLLFIASGCLVWALPRVWNLNHHRVATALLGGALLIGQLSSIASIYPHHLAYFNALSGGAARGYERLVDSSLDWGQDLPGFAQYLVENSESSAPTYLAYFGTGEPAQHQIATKTVMRLPKFDLEFDWFPLRAGKYAISATLLQHVYRQNHQPWSAESESTYQKLRNLETAFWAINGHPEQHLELLDGASSEEWHHAWDLYSELRFARLCEYLKTRPPEAMIGYSILIFDLSQQELDQALGADLPALIKLIEGNASKVRNPEIY